MSFLDVAWARLGIDPVESGVRLVDGHEFATAAAGVSGAVLVAHTHANWVLSDIKLSLDDPSGDLDATPVVLLHALGTPRRADRRDHVGRHGPHDRRRPPHLALHPVARRARRRRLRALPRARPHAARAVPVGHRADPPLARALSRRGDLRGGRRDRAARPRRARPPTRPDRGAGRPAVPDRVPRHDRRAGGPLHDRRRHARDPRQARAPAPARVRRPAGATVVDVDGAEVLANWDAIKQQEKAGTAKRTSVFDGIPGRSPRSRSP
jgi:hypothetical protein